MKPEFNPGPEEYQLLSTLHDNQQNLNMACRLVIVNIKFHDSELYCSYE